MHISNQDSILELSVQYTSWAACSVIYPPSQARGIDWGANKHLRTFLTNEISWKSTPKIFPCCLISYRSFGWFFHGVSIRINYFHLDGLRSFQIIIRWQWGRRWWKDNFYSVDVAERLWVYKWSVGWMWLEINCFCFDALLVDHTLAIRDIKRRKVDFGSKRRQQPNSVLHEDWGTNTTSWSRMRYHRVEDNDRYFEKMVIGNSWLHFSLDFD